MFGVRKQTIFVAAGKKVMVLTRAARRRHRASSKIGAAWREHAKRIGPDPIMLTPIETPWRHVDARTNVVTYFCATSLAQYIESTGVTTHPLTRVPFTSIEIRRLQRASGIDLDSALERHASESTRAHESPDAIHGFLETDVANVVQTIVEDASNPDLSEMDAMIRCRLHHGGNFTEALANLRALAPALVDTACDRALSGIRRMRGTAAHGSVLAWAENLVERRRHGGPFHNTNQPLHRIAQEWLPIPPPPPQAANEALLRGLRARRVRSLSSLGDLVIPPMPPTNAFGFFGDGTRRRHPMFRPL